MLYWFNSFLIKPILHNTDIYAMSLFIVNQTFIVSDHDMSIKEVNRHTIIYIGLIIIELVFYNIDIINVYTELKNLQFSSEYC